MKNKIVLTAGTFDLIHIGHIKFLKEAKRVGGKNSKLFVILTNDENVKKLKGRKPIFNQIERKNIVGSIRFVDKVFLGDRKIDYASKIKKIKPNVIVFGYDQSEIMQKIKEIVKKERMKIKIIKLPKFSIWSTSKIRSRWEHS
jgi:FAD synthetase